MQNNNQNQINENQINQNQKILDISSLFFRDVLSRELIFKRIRENQDILNMNEYIKCLDEDLSDNKYASIIFNSALAVLSIATAVILNDFLFLFGLVGVLFTSLYCYIDYCDLEKNQMLELKHNFENNEKVKKVIEKIVEGKNQENQKNQ